MNLVVNGLNLHYDFTKTDKETETILFLHGFGGSVISLKGLQDKLSAEFNTLNLDLLGFGESDKVPASFTIYDYAKLVYDFLVALQIEKVNIVSHSFGGRIAIILAANYPELVSRLVLIDSAGVKPKFNFFTFFKIRYYKFLKQLVKCEIIKKDYLKKFGSTDYKNLNDNEKQVFKRVIKEDLTPLLKHIKVPTLILWGSRDKSTPLYMAKKLKKHIKNSGMIVFSGAGHYSYIDEFFKTQLILKSFLKSEMKNEFN